MICTPCRTAGRMNQSNQPGMARMVHTREGPVFIETSDPADMHARCEAPTTCPCQHKLGNYIQVLPGK